MNPLAVTVNGEGRDLAVGATVSDLVQDLPGSGRGTAVARNGEVVPRSQWPTTLLSDGDRVEILGAAQGG